MSVVIFFFLNDSFCKLERGFKGKESHSYVFWPQTHANHLPSPPCVPPPPFMVAMIAISLFFNIEVAFIYLLIFWPHRANKWMNDRSTVPSTYSLFHWQGEQFQILKVKRHILPCLLYTDSWSCVKVWHQKAKYHIFSHPHAKPHNNYRLYMWNFQTFAKEN